MFIRNILVGVCDEAQVSQVSFKLTSQIHFQIHLIQMLPCIVVCWGMMHGYGLHLIAFPIGQATA